jgi:ankyrin repeat protein
MNDGEVEEAVLENGVILPDAERHEDAIRNGFGVQEIEEDLTMLQQHIEEGQWGEALNRLRSHPDEVYHPKAQPGSNSKAMTALHLALETGECPLPLIQALLVRKPLAAGIRDNKGNTPLHIACAGQFAFNHGVIGCLLAAYPQAVLLPEDTDGETPLHLLLTLGGDVCMTCITMILDVAYSRMAGLPLGYVPLVDMICSPLSTSLQILANYPPIMVQFIRQMAIDDPFHFPACFQPFLFLPQPETIESKPELMDNQPELLMMRDSKGHTPLHICCSSSLPADVIRMVLSEDRYPGALEACSVVDNKGRHALFYGAAYLLPFDGAKLVFDVNPDVVRHLEQYRLLYPHVAYISPASSQEDRTLALISRRENPRQDPQSCFGTESMYKLYSVVEFYVRLTYHGTYVDPPPGCARWRALHGIAAVPSPPQVVRAAVGLYPWLLEERDEDNDLPLHIACKNRYEGGHDDIHYWCLRGVSREKVHHRLHPEDLERDNPITILADSCPKAATYLDRDYCLPLHNAICSHKGWKDGIKSLISAAPMALETRDGKHHLYPFLLAAMDDVNTLDVVYGLLISNPTVVRDAIYASRQLQQPNMEPPVFADDPGLTPGRSLSNKRIKLSDDEQDDEDGIG